MDNHRKLVDVFAATLSIDAAEVTDNLSYSAGGWDSVAHMGLVAAIEGAFDVMLSTDEVIDMSSFAKAKEILGTHGITFGDQR